MAKQVVFTPMKLQELKQAQQQALAAGKNRYDSFTFDGEDYVVGYVEYLVAFLERRFGPMK